MTWTPPNL